MINTFLGTKQRQTQAFLENGIRIPVTEVLVNPTPVISIKMKDKSGYCALQVGAGIRKKANKALNGHVKGANLKNAPYFLREVKISEEDVANYKVGDIVKPADVLKPGDVVSVIGKSKGKGYAGVVKRHHFKGGPKTHGQSDRLRAPGSIGQTTTPGRVYKGKRMAGKMGNEKATVQNLVVIEVLENKILVKGLIPGIRNGLVILKKTGESKKFVPLLKEVTEETKETKETEAKAQEVKAEEKVQDESNEIQEEKQVEEVVVKEKEEGKNA